MVQYCTTLDHALSRFSQCHHYQQKKSESSEQPLFHVESLKAILKGTGQLPFHARGIAERPKQVEEGANAKLLPDRANKTHGGFALFKNLIMSVVRVILQASYGESSSRQNTVSLPCHLTLTIFIECFSPFGALESFTAQL